jgi:hypothetical protein
MGAKLNLELGYITPLALPLFGAKLDLALGAEYNLKETKVQGFRVI